VSYQQEIRNVVSSAIDKGSHVSLDVTVAHPGTFEMKVILRNQSTSYESTFDLSNGLTPRIRRSITDWVDLVMSPRGSGGEPEIVN
jgi:hypothetical protein